MGFRDGMLLRGRSQWRQMPISTKIGAVIWGEKYAGRRDDVQHGTRWISFSSWNTVVRTIGSRARLTRIGA